MPHLPDHAHLWDMLDAARSVLEFVGDRSRTEYMADPMAQAAVERKIEIIGEAAGRVSSEFKNARPEIPWRRIIGQRSHSGAFPRDRFQFFPYSSLFVSMRGTTSSMV